MIYEVWCYDYENQDADSCVFHTHDLDHAFRAANHYNEGHPRLHNCRVKDNHDCLMEPPTYCPECYSEIINGYCPVCETSWINDEVQP